MSFRATPRGRRALLAALLYLAALAVGALTLRRPLSEFDEGFILVGAERILAGELPYRDFYALYPPGQYAVVAALIALFGKQVMTLRIYCLLVRAAVALLAFLVARTLSPPRAKFAPWAAWAGAVAWSTTFGNFGYPAYPALALILFAHWRLLATGEPQPDEGAAPPGIARRDLALAGAAFGLAALFRHDLAAYGLIAALPRLTTGTSGSGGSGRWRNLLPFAGALAGVFVPVAALVVATTSWREIWFELIRYPGESYAKMRSLPYPPLLVGRLGWESFVDLRRLASTLPGMPFLMPIVAALAALGTGAFLSRSQREGATRRSASALAGFGLLVLLLANLARVRPDAAHAAPSVIAGFVAAAAAVAHALRLARNASSGGWALRLAAAGLALVAAAAAVPAVALLTMAGVWPFATGAPDGVEDPMRASHLEAGRGRREVASFLREQVPAGGRIFVGCARHDRLILNEPIFYFLADRLPGSMYHALDPGVATTRPVQERIVRDLEAMHVDWVLLSDMGGQRDEPNGSAVSSGVTLLDDYFRTRFRPVATFAPIYTVLRRSGGERTVSP